jgi:DNA repair exonuclease SbcCD ATPase subunit
VLNNLKQKYNELGLRVTTGKSELEKAFKIAKKFRKEHNLINEFLNKIDGELKKVEQKPLSKNYLDELEWIKNTRFEISKVENNIETLQNLQKSLQDFVKVKDRVLHDSSNKVKEVIEKLTLIEKRLDNRANFIHVITIFFLNTFFFKLKIFFFKGRITFIRRKLSIIFNSYS